MPDQALLYFQSSQIELHVAASGHGHIVAVLDVYENAYNDVQCLLVVMEKMEGGELFARIQVISLPKI